jgi:hypothetical protein
VLYPSYPLFLLSPNHEQMYFLFFLFHVSLFDIWIKNVTHFSESTIFALEVVLEDLTNIESLYLIVLRRGTVLA